MTLPRRPRYIPRYLLCPSPYFSFSAWHEGGGSPRSGWAEEEKKQKCDGRHRYPFPIPEKLPFKAKKKIQREPKMTIEIDLNHVVDESIPVVIVLLCFFVGMRILYGYWPWQEGPKRRRLRPVKPVPDTAATLKRAEPVAGPALQPDPEINEPQPNCTLVPAVALPAITGATEDSFDRLPIKPDEARPHAA